MSATAAAACLTRIEVGQANTLLVAWAHNLGPSRRPFGAQAWLLEVDGLPVSVAVSASTVSAQVAGYRRNQVVELARLCSAPGQAWATRPMLRLWREVAAPSWPYWPVHAAVSYSQNTRHPGGIYRFDGWTRVTDRAGSTGGGGSWSNRRQAGDPAGGRKSLWLWPYKEEGVTG